MERLDVKEEAILNSSSGQGAHISWNFIPDDVGEREGTEGLRNETRAITESISRTLDRSGDQDRVQDHVQDQVQDQELGSKPYCHVCWEIELNEDPEAYETTLEGSDAQKLNREVQVTSVRGLGLRMKEFKVLSRCNLDLSEGNIERSENIEGPWRLPVRFRVLFKV